MIILGIGSSIEPKEFYLKEAIRCLDEHDDIEVLNISKVYLTKAWGGVAKNTFLNICVEIKCLKKAEELLKITQEIEYKLGRIRKEYWSDRTIDIDILLFNSELINTEYLIVPHKYITERNFVLYPMYDICKDLILKDKPIIYWLKKSSKEITVYKEKL